MENNQLFLMGLGRSGTTLVQRVLNTLPNTMIWGEHSGFLNQVAAQYYFLKENKSMHEFSYSKDVPEVERLRLSYYKDPKLWQAWINWYQPGDLGSIFRDFIESFFCPESFNDIKIWGFKEIRYGADDQVIKFLAELYPDSRFVFIVRESLNNIESQITTFHRGQSRFMVIKRLLLFPTIIKIARKWKKQNKYYVYLSKKEPERYYLYHYEEILDDLSLLDDCLENFDLKIDEKQQQILEMKDGRGSHFDPGSSVHLRWKRLGIFPAMVAEIFVGHTSKIMGYARPKTLIASTVISGLIDKTFKQSVKE